ncbi:Cytochrome C oxidase, cbb3-type, subunit III [Atopomonas hussainii]|uniref:Cytochrome C oxidase, cbb3-type, subunit III n=1 Tax=Atopomonas hussainii TaxID=1429083 RepID=A0A1H7HRI3_9GAMM|nr:cytochrome c [Atopomonas hussainii]SEK52966.1 Cytochrome C oxidase, cbb3-type, subunit III [Atopomonas hussainii]
MKNKHIYFALFIAMTLGTAANAETPLGKELYSEHCSKCHGDNGKARTLRGWLFFAQNLSKASWQSRESDDELAAAIRRGPGAMPAYEGTLTDAEIDQLVAHIRTLKQP